MPCSPGASCPPETKLEGTGAAELEGMTDDGNTEELGDGGVEDVDGATVEEGVGVGVGVGVGAGLDATGAPKIQSPVKTPADSDAKNSKRPREKSRPPGGQPGHYQKK